MLFNKKKKKNKALTSAEKEEKFVKISTRLLMIVVILLAVTFSFLSILNRFKQSDLTALKELAKEVNEDDIVTNPFFEADLNSAILKCQTAGLDIVDGNSFSLEKFNNVNITISENITLTAAEFGAMYNNIYADAPDKYSTILRQLEFFKTESGYKIKIVCTVDFKLLLNNLATSLTDLPTRIFVTSEAEIKNGVSSPLKLTYNALDETLSNQLSTSLNQSSGNTNVQTYFATLISDFITKLTQRTNTGATVDNDKITFSLKTE